MLNVKYRAKKGIKNTFGCVISHIQYALKGQKLLAQGIALGLKQIQKVALKGQKLSISKLLPFQGDFAFC